jgi:putative transposase
VDLNLVRARAVSHPKHWRHAGYNEIQHPRRKYILIDYEKVSRLSGFDSYESFRSTHRGWIQSALKHDRLKREDCWTRSIATGSRSFVEKVKKQMQGFAVGRKIRDKTEGFELREPQSAYKSFFDTIKSDIDEKNGWFWDE